MTKISEILKGPRAPAPVPVNPEDGRITMRLSDVERKDVEWLWRPYIPMGMVTLITGDPEAGKGWVTMDIAARVSTGRPFPEQEGMREPGRVLFLSAEDSPEHVLRPRLEHQEADCSRIWLTSKTCNLTAQSGQDRLMRMIREADPKLIVIDPITSWVGETDVNRTSTINDLFGTLAGVAGKTGAAIVTVRHRRKPADGERKSRDPKFSGLGSIAFTGSARSELLIGVAEDGQRAMAHEKCSVGPHGPSLAYKLDPETGKLTWEGETDLQGWDLMGTLPKRKRGRPAVKSAAAKEFLQKFLAHGPEPAMVCIQEAEKQGITKATLVLAKPGLVIPYRDRDQWWWTLEGASIGREKKQVCA